MAMCSINEILSELGSGYWVASTDVSSGFHHVVMHPADRPYQCYQALGYYLQPTRLMFGLRQAPPQFCTVTAEVVATCQRMVNTDELRGFKIVFKVYVDDIFVIAPTREGCEIGLATLLGYCSAVGIVLADSKTRPPAQVAIPLLGLEVDTVAMTVMIPAAKRYRNLALLHAALEAGRRKQAFPAEAMRKIAGLLTHCIAVIWDGSMWMAPIWQAAATSSGAVMVHQWPGLQRSLAAWAGMMAASHRCSTPLIHRSLRPRPRPSECLGSLRAPTPPATRALR